MARQIKLRLTAAKVSVSMALLALIAGIAEKAGARPATPNATPTATPAALPGGISLLKLTGLTGAVGTDFHKLDQSFVKLDLSFVKLDNTLTTFEHKLASSYYTERKLNAIFLKSSTANSEFLKVTDANLKYLKIGDTASNSWELGGSGEQAFVRNASGMAAVPYGGAYPSQPLLATSDGRLSVSIGYSVQLPTGPFVEITNNSGSDVQAIENLGGVDSQITLTSASPTFMALPLGNGNAAMLHLQLFPVPRLFGNDKGEAVTLIISVERDAGTNQLRFVGQLIAGSLS